jgi:predicted RNase H-like nuclease (RuvC/YqgF family)
MSFSDRIDNLPTLDDDERWQTLLASMKRLGAEIDALKEEIPELEDKAETLREEAEEIEIEVHADPDLSEKDVQKALTAAEKAESTLQTKRRELEKKTEALDRIQERREDERLAAGARVYDQYADVAEDIYDVVINRAEALQDALGVLDALRAKGTEAAVNAAAMADTQMPPAIRTDSDRAAKVQELKEMAAGWITDHERKTDSE